jgi:hypothetical protein
MLISQEVGPGFSGLHVHAVVMAGSGKEAKVVN